MAGSYPERVKVTRSGAAGAPITFETQGTVEMQGFTVTASYITLQGFRISSTSQDTTDGWGVYIKGTHNVVASNYIYHSTWGGVILFDNTANASISSYNIVEGNTITQVGEVGIDVRGHNELVQQNDISYVMQYPSWMNNPPSYVDADGIHFFGSNNDIRQNSIHDINYAQPENKSPHIDCFQTWADTNHPAAQNIVIEQNLCSLPDLAHSVGEGSAGFTIQKNAGLITIRNNIINTFIGFFIGGKGEVGNGGVAIYNNDIIGQLNQNPAYYPAGIWDVGAPGVVAEDNIIYNKIGDVVYVGSGGSVTGSHNLAYRSDGTTPAAEGYSHPSDLWGVNPLFVNAASGNYLLQASSPAKDTGLATSDPNDYAGNPRPLGAGYDIGAYEQ